MAPRRPHFTQFSLVAQLQPHSALDARRDIDLKASGAGQTAASAAVGARVGDANSLAAAGGAGGRDLEEPARLDDLAASAAIIAGRRDGPLAGARAAAFAAIVLPAHVDRPRCAPRRLDELDLQLHEQVGARPGPAPAFAEKVAEQPAAEDVAEGRHDVVGRPKVVKGRPVQAGMAVTVVTLTLFGVRQDFVRFRRFLESLRRLFITRIAVRMILESHLAIGFLDIVGGRFAHDPEHFVVIALRGCHRHGVSID